MARKSYDEDRVQIAICNYLRLFGYVFTFTGGGMIKDYRTQKTANRLGYLKGVSDLIVWIPGGTVCIEVKKPATYRWSDRFKRLVIDKEAGDQTDEQIEFEKVVTSLPGQHYVVAKSVDDVDKYFKENKISPK